MKGPGEKAAYFTAAAAMLFILLGAGWAWNKFLFGADTFSLHLPFFLFAKKVWMAYHELPLWMPDIFLGMPAIDSTNLIYFYPTNLLFMLLPLPAEQMFVFDQFLHMAAAAFGMYLLLSRHKIAAQAAFFGAVFYMLSGPLVSFAYNGHWPDIKALALAPFVLYFVNRGIIDKKIFYYLSAGLILGLVMLGIGMQVGAYTYVAAALYGGWLLYEKKAGKKEIAINAAMFLVAGIATALFSAPQFLPAQNYMQFSWRKDLLYNEFTEFSFPPGEIITLLLPQFFGLKDHMYWGELKGLSMTYYCGLAVFFLAPFAFLSSKHKRGAVFFLCLGLLFAVFSFGGYTPLYKILYYVPVFNKFRNPARLLTMLPIFLSFLAAAGLDNIISAAKGSAESEKNRKITVLITKWFAVAAGALILLAVAGRAIEGLVSGIYIMSRGKVTGAAMPHGADSAIAALIRQDIVFLAAAGALILLLMYLKNLGKIKSAFVFVMLLAAFQFADIWRIERQFIVYRTTAEVAEKNRVYEYVKNNPGLYRLADLNFAWYPNKSMYYGMEFFAGFHAIITAKTYGLLAGDTYKHINIMRLFNVRYYLNSGNPREYSDRGLEKAVDGPVNLFEDKNYLPRVFFSSRVKVLGGDDEILAYMKSPEFDPREVLAKDSIKPAENTAKEEASTEITMYSPNRIKARVKSNKDGILVLSNQYYPAWKVMVDKKPERIYNVDYCLSGVRLKAGEHEAEFYYDPGFIIACIWLMIASFIGYAAVYFIEFRRKKRQ